MKILINTPALYIPGGVANHYKGLQNFWSEDVSYNYIGGRKGIQGPSILIFDYIKFIFLCAFGNYDVILLNPSLGKTAIQRDAWFLRISKWFNLKTFVFFHGWDDSLAQRISESPEGFVKKYNRADGFIVLANVFRNQMKNWGISSPIQLSTTKVDNSLLNKFDLGQKSWNKTILFLARIEEKKGIFTTINAFKQVLAKFPEAKLKVAGNGRALERAKQFVLDQTIANVEFLGHTSGDKLIESFSQSSVYILPTTHGEGMPTSVLESMSFGLPVISRPVGGLVDFFQEGKMGYLLESIEPGGYADKIIDLLRNEDKLEEIGKFNHEYAKNQFMASKVALEIENILRNVRSN